MEFEKIKSFFENKKNKTDSKNQKQRYYPIHNLVWVLSENKNGKPMLSLAFKRDNENGFYDCKTEQKIDEQNVLQDFCEFSSATYKVNCIKLDYNGKQLRFMPVGFYGFSDNRYVIDAVSCNEDIIASKYTSCNVNSSNSPILFPICSLSKQDKNSLSPSLCISEDVLDKTLKYSNKELKFNIKVLEDKIKSNKQKEIAVKKAEEKRIEQVKQCKQGMVK